MDGRDHWTTSPLEHRSLSGANNDNNEIETKNRNSHVWLISNSALKIIMNDSSDIKWLDQVQEMTMMIVDIYEKLQKKLQNNLYRRVRIGQPGFSTMLPETIGEL